MVHKKDDMYVRSYSLDRFNKIDRNRWRCATSALYRRLADRRSFQNVKKCLWAALIENHLNGLIHYMTPIYASPILLYVERSVKMQQQNKNRKKSAIENFLIRVESG